MRSRIMLAAALPLLALASTAGAQYSETSSAHQLINANCTRCHSADRVLKADPAKIPDIVDRMQQLSPEAFRGVDQEALKEGLAKVLRDPQVAAGRAAWDEAVARGRALFNDVTLGATGKSCASCHKAEDLKGVADRYPQYVAKLGRVVVLQEWLRMMIEVKLGGQQLPVGDPRTTALEAYLKSLR
jgi:mono/diheme cytochrome c family protein